MAASVPSGMAIMVEISVAKRATSSVKGRRIRSSSSTGAPLHVEGPVEAHFCSQALEVLQVDIAALLTSAEDQQGDVPGDDVHQQEDHQGCPEQGRHH